MFNFLENIFIYSKAYCDGIPNLLYILDTNYAPKLLFYSYIPISLCAIFLASYIFIKNKNTVSFLLLILSFIFSLNILNELVTWLSVPVNLNYFGWEMSAVFHTLIVLISVLLFINILNIKNNKHLSIIFLIFSPVLIFLHTRYNMINFDVGECNAINGPLWYYIYLIEILALFYVIYLFINKLHQTKDKIERGQVVYLGIGQIIFLAIFVATNILGDYALVYEINLLGPLGMLGFIIFISLSIIKYKTFNIKLIAPQALVFALIFLNFAILFIRRVENVRIVIIFTIIISSILGYVMIRSVKKEIKSREHIQKLADELEIAGEAQAETLRFITHQVKGVFTNTKGALSSILEGDYDPISESLRKMVQNLFVIQNGGVDSVQAFLSASQLENGNPYVMKDINFKDIVSEACIQLKMKAEKKGLVFETSILEGESYKMMGDGVYLSNAILNIINNAVCYTKTGSIHVALSKTEDKFALFSVKDTGVGITQEDGQQLFTKYGHGKDSRLINVDSNGLGLYLVKKIIDAHQGTVWYESEVGKGTTFFVKLPLV